MRAVCESCGKPQPADWKAGDVCVHCGAASRREVRCFWCARWTPQAKYCRSCGAETVEPRLYGAARMIKEAGTDRFTIPRMLRELDPDQVENFTRIYQRHAAAVARHVDEVRFVERFLFHTSFSASLEEELVPQLPWSEATLASLSAPPLPAGDDRATLKAIEASTPFPRTRSLAALARLRLDEWGAARAAHAAFQDPALRAEAALVLTGWRVRCSVSRVRNEDELYEELARSPFRLEAGVRLRRDAALLREALTSRDRETAFAAALALDDVDRLQAALRDGDDLERSVAGAALIRLGIIQPVVEPIRKSPIEVQRELVEALVSRDEPAPEAEKTLLEIVEATEDGTLRERAARVLCRQLRPELAMRIARAAKGERYIFQSLLSEKAALPPGTVRELVAWMVENGHFTMNQYGLSDAGKRGAIPDDFVPGIFARAEGKTRDELLRLTEVQIEARNDEALHRFVLNVAYGPYPAATRAAAWWVLRRGYRRDDARARGPFRIEKDAIERFFGSVGEFIPRLTAVLRDPASLKEVGFYDHLADVLDEADPAVAPAFFAEEGATHDLVRALLEAAARDYWPQLRSGMVKFLGVVGTHPRWRGDVVAELGRLHQAGQTGDSYWSERILKRLRVSPLGLSEDEESWRKTPADLVLGNFESADDELRRLLLDVADMQLRERWGRKSQRKPEDEKLLPFLLGVVLGGYPEPTRAAAGKVYAYWSRDLGIPLRVREDRVLHYFGSWQAFLPRLTEALRDESCREVLEGVLGEVGPEVAPAFLKEEACAHELVRVSLGLLSGKGSEELKEGVLKLLAVVGPHPRWRDDVVGALRRLAESPDFPLPNSVAQALRRLEPPRRVAPVASPVPDVRASVQAKQEEAQRLAQELQATVLKIAHGALSPEEKMREMTRLQTEFQARIRELYGG